MQQASEQAKRLFDEDLRFQQRQWTAERTGWFLMVALLVSALLGFFGGGVFSSATVTSADRELSVEYARFARYQAPTAITIHVAPSTGRKQLRLRVSRSYLNEMRVRSIAPQPVATEVADPAWTFVFDRASANATASSIRFDLEPDKVGSHGGWVAIDDGPPIRFDQFIYP